MTRSWLGGILGVSLALALVALTSLENASARAYRGYNNRGNNTGSNTPKAATRSAASQPTTLPLAEDQANVQATRQKLMQVGSSLQSAFEQSSQFTTAAAALAKAQADYNSATSQVMSGLRQNSEYIADLEAKKTASDSLALARQATNPAPETISSLASAVMDASTKVTAMEHTALTADPTVTTTRAALTTAAAHLDKIKADFQASLKNNADWQAAKSDYDAAQAKLAADLAKAG